MKADLHCHSKFSDQPSLWLMRQFKCPESFTAPSELYQIQRAKGMDLVTITDHDTIRGCLEIADRPGAFISEEVTTKFPEDGCKLHVLAYDINEAIHADIQSLAGNVYEMLDYLRINKIVHALAHPFYSVNDMLTVEHVEKCALLFKNWEINGDQNPEANANIRSAVGAMTPELIDRLSLKHRIIPAFDQPWRKNLIAGSDDHSGLHLARGYTQVDGAADAADFLDGILDERASIRVKDATPDTLAHNYYGIMYQFFEQKYATSRYFHKDVFMRFLDLTLKTRLSREDGPLRRIQFAVTRRLTRRPAEPDDSFLQTIRREGRQVIEEIPSFERTINRGGTEESVEQLWGEFFNRLSSRALSRFAERALSGLAGGRILDTFSTLGSSGALYSLLSPYVAGYSLFAKERAFGDRALAALTGSQHSEPDRIAHFTDTFHEVNGVALTLRQQLRMARSQGRDYSIITCAPEGAEDNEPGVINFRPVGSFALPEYPQQQVVIPPFLDILRWCYENRITRIHTATPGPVGLVALAVARILNIPICGTYHTAFPQYARFLTGDSFIEDMTWKAMLWYYGQMEAVFTPSEATGRELIERGIPASRIRSYPRGVDIDRFNPIRRGDFLRRRYSIREDRVKLLYVGRVSREKNMHLLAEAFQAAIARGAHAHLIVVGDGPYLEEMRRKLAEAPATFTGYLMGDDLANAYADSDLFVFPSTTDTFGNVVLEAQASGLPLIVTDMGGPKENVVDGETGMIVAGESVSALVDGIALMIEHPNRLAAMGRAARKAAETRAFDHGFDETSTILDELRRLKVALL